MDKKELFHKLVAFAASVHQVTHEMTKDAKAGAITSLQYDILQYIAVSQPVTPSDISQCQHMSMPNTSRELKKLCEKNLCEKYTAESDRRKQYIRLTPAGEAVMNASFAHIEALLLKRVQHASDEQIDEIGRAMDLLQSKVFYSERSR